MDKGRGGTNLQKTEARPGEGNAWTRFSKLTKKKASNPGGDEHARSWGCPYVQKRDMQSSWGFLELQRGEPQRSGQAGHMNSQTWNLKLGEEDEEGRRPKSQLRGCLGLGKRLVMKSGHGQSFPHRPQPPPHPIPYFWSPQSSGSELTRCSISPSGWQWLDTCVSPKFSSTTLSPHTLHWSQSASTPPWWKVHLGLPWDLGGGRSTFLLCIPPTHLPGVDLHQPSSAGRRGN